MKKKNRYFVVSFRSKLNGHSLTGMINLSTNGCYISANETKINIKNNLKEYVQFKDVQIENIEIINIIELTASDYKDLIS